MSDNNEITVTQGSCDDYLVLDCQIKDVYSGIAVVEVNNGTQYGHIAFPSTDLGEDVAVGDAVQMILLLRPTAAVVEEQIH